MRGEDDFPDVVQEQSIWQSHLGEILYPCHQFVGEEEFLMGNVDEGIVETGDCR